METVHVILVASGPSGKGDSEKVSAVCSAKKRPQDPKTLLFGTFFSSKSTYVIQSIATGIECGRDCKTSPYKFCTGLSINLYPQKIGNTDPVRETRLWYNLIGEVVQSLYGLLFEQTSPSIPVAIDCTTIYGSKAICKLKQRRNKKAHYMNTVCQMIHYYITTFRPSQLLTKNSVVKIDHLPGRLNARRCIMMPPRLGRSRIGRTGMPILLSFLLLLLVPRGAGALFFKTPTRPRHEKGSAIPGGVAEAQAILKAAGVADPKVLKRFADEGVDVAALYACQRADLEELGVTKRGQQIKLNEEVAKYLAQQLDLIDYLFFKVRLVASGVSHAKEWIVAVWGSLWAYACNRVSKTPSTSSAASSTSRQTKRPRSKASSSAATAPSTSSAASSSAIHKLSGVKHIKTDEKAKVEGLFLGGDPFFVQCAASVDQLHRTFLDAAADLSGAGVTPAVIDCDGKLPSGKTVKERFFKDRVLEEPVFFVVANRQPPRPFSIKSHITPEMLVSFASNVTAVKVTRISDAKDFKESCLRRKRCALVIYDGNYTEGEAAAVKAAALEHRGIAVCELDTRKLRCVSSAPPAPHTHIQRERERERERKREREITDRGCAAGEQGLGDRY